MRGRDVATALAVLGLVVALFGAVALSVDPARDDDQFTALYLLNESGEASGYPNELEPDERATVRVGVRNAEGERRRYRVVVRLADRRVTTYRLELADGERTERPVTFAASETGRHRLRVLLFLDGGAEPYRRASIRVFVRERTTGG